MSVSGRIARNASMLMVAQAVTWTLTLGLTIVMTRTLGAEGVGRLQIAASIWGLLAVLLSFGMDTLLTKSIAREPAHAVALVRTSALLRLLLFLPATGIAVVWSSLLAYPSETVAVILATGCATLLWTLASGYQAALQGLEQMSQVSLGIMISKAVSALLSIALLLAGGAALAVAIAGIVGASVMLTAQIRALKRATQRQTTPMREAYTPVTESRRNAARQMLHAGIPYLMSSIFLVGYQQIDVITMSILADERTVGWYGAANQLFGSLLFIPTIFITAIFPTLTRAYADGDAKLPQLTGRSFNLMLALSVPIGLGISAIAEPLTLLLFGADFAPTAPVLALFGIVLVLTYQNILLGQFLISADRQNAWTIVMAVATVATVVLDIILVPWSRMTYGNGAIGGALSYVATELGMLIIGCILLPRGILGWNALHTAARAVLAGLGMMAVVWMLREWFILIPIMTGAAVYSILALVLGAISAADRLLIFGILRGLATRMGRAAAWATREG